MVRRQGRSRRLSADHASRRVRQARVPRGRGQGRGGRRSHLSRAREAPSPGASPADGGRKPRRTAKGRGGLREPAPPLRLVPGRRPERGGRGQQFQRVDPRHEVLHRRAERRRCAPRGRRPRHRARATRQASALPQQRASIFPPLGHYVHEPRDVAGRRPAEARVGRLVTRELALVRGVAEVLAVPGDADEIERLERLRGLRVASWPQRRDGRVQVLRVGQGLLVRVQRLVPAAEAGERLVGVDLDAEQGRVDRRPAPGRGSIALRAS